MRLEASFKIDSQFDHQDSIDLHFSDPIEKFLNFSFPITNPVSLGIDGDGNDRWRLFLKPRAVFQNNQLSWGAIIKHRGVTPLIFTVEMCPCSQDISPFSKTLGLYSKVL